MSKKIENVHVSTEGPVPSGEWLLRKLIDLLADQYGVKAEEVKITIKNDGAA